MSEVKYKSFKCIVVDSTLHEDDNEMLVATMKTCKGPERGKGIPQVYECSQDVAFSKFILISNDIFADLKTNSWRLLKSPFDGTMFYWELTNKNENNGN